ncbi:MAG: ABC transporter ATP-binding protein/permease [Treponemataceae bacterium]|nr:ABC transporter ATP-binding protein/permease [Treponemataceae bacterium]
MSSIKKLLLGLEKKYKISAVFAPIAIMGEVLMEVLIPLIMAKIIDVGMANNDAGIVMTYGLLMIGSALLSLAFGVGAGRLAAVAALGFSRNLRKRLFSKVQDFSFGNVDKFSTASLVTRLTTDVTNCQNTFQMIIRMCIRAPFMFIAAIILSFRINSELAMIFIVAIPCILIPVLLIMRKAFPLFEAMMKKYDGLNATVQENLTGIRAVKAFVREDHETQKFRDAADAVRVMQVKAERLVILNFPIMMMVMNLSMIAIFWFGGNLIIGGRMQTGELISFTTYLMQILMSLMMISMIFVMLVLSKASIKRIVEVLDEDPDIKNPAAAAASDASAGPADGAIKFTDVSFSYDKRAETAVLRNINLDIKAGQTVGIVGGTGSSKSTLVMMIPRLYDVLSGSVEVGGKNVKDYTMEALRDSVAMVLQKNVLFSGTIAENLRWGNPDATDEQLVEVCKIASAHDFVAGFPEGYATELGQGGVNLSGGQKQRLCIARALLKKPKILILDDSTSAVDTATDASIRKALRETLPDTTKIIIAQRLSSVKDADVIFVLDEGEINASGTHEQLLETCEIYREVYESQQKGNDDFDEPEADVMITEEDLKKKKEAAAAAEKGGF